MKDNNEYHSFEKWRQKGKGMSLAGGGVDLKQGGGGEGGHGWSGARG